MRDTIRVAKPCNIYRLGSDYLGELPKKENILGTRSTAELKPPERRMY